MGRNEEKWGFNGYKVEKKKSDKSSGKKRREETLNFGARESGLLQNCHWIVTVPTAISVGQWVMD